LQNSQKLQILKRFLQILKPKLEPIGSFVGQPFPVPFECRLLSLMGLSRQNPRKNNDFQFTCCFPKQFQKEMPIFAPTLIF
jgi:hypothetical protein